MTKTMTAEEVERDTQALAKLLGVPVSELEPQFPFASRLAAQAARVPGLESANAALALTLGSACDSLVSAGHRELAERWRAGLALASSGTALLVRLRNTESERDAARKDAARTSRYLGLLDQMFPDVGGDDTNTLIRGYGDKITALRERVATLVADNAALSNGIADALDAMGDDLNALAGALNAARASRKAAPPGLREAAGYALECLTAADAHPNVVARLRAAYDATGGRHAKTMAECSDAQGRAARDEAIAEDMEDAAKYRAAVERWESGDFVGWQPGRAVHFVLTGQDRGPEPLDTPPSGPGGGESVTDDGESLRLKCATPGCESEAVYTGLDRNTKAVRNGWVMPVDGVVHCQRDHSTVSVAPTPTPERTQEEMDADASAWIAEQPRAQAPRRKMTPTPEAEPTIDVERSPDANAEAWAKGVRAKKASIRETFAAIQREREEWERKVAAGMPRCPYGNEGGPCRSAPEANGWCTYHQHIAAIHEARAQPTPEGKTIQGIIEQGGTPPVGDASHPPQPTTPAVVWEGEEEHGRRTQLFADGRIEPAWDNPSSCVNAMFQLARALAEAKRANAELVSGLAESADDAKACRTLIDAATESETVEDAMSATEGWRSMSGIQQDAAHVRVAIAKLRELPRKAAESMRERVEALVRGMEMNGCTKSNLIEALRALPLE